jgi:hypothetical protein
MVLVDDRSRHTWAYFLKNLKDWMVKVERFTERMVKAVRSDNGGEYTNTRKEFEIIFACSESNIRRAVPLGSPV